MIIKGFLLNWKNDMTKLWIKKAVEYLKQSLFPIPHELNEIDWKENLSPDNKRLCNHLSAFSNYPGGGFLVFGIEDTTAELKGITKENAEEIVLKLSNLSRDSLNPAVSIDHSIEEYDRYCLFILKRVPSNLFPVQDPLRMHIFEVGEQQGRRHVRNWDFLC